MAHQGPAHGSRRRRPLPPARGVAVSPIGRAPSVHQPHPHRARTRPLVQPVRRGGIWIRRRRRAGPVQPARLLETRKRNGPLGLPRRPAKAPAQTRWLLRTPGSRRPVVAAHSIGLGMNTDISPLTGMDSHYLNSKHVPQQPTSRGDTMSCPRSP